MTLAPADLRRGSTVTARGLTKTFGGVTVLHPIDLEVPAGQILVLLGPSGCGKTTLLRLVAGLEIPDGPDMIRFDGQDVSALPIERRNVGMVFQSYALFPNMSVAENVAYGLKIRRIGRAERDAETRRLLALVGIEELADRRISQVSGGQRQRIALARALAIKPRILLLDEPLAALDAVLRERLRVEIGLLLREFGITALYVTHDQAEAMAIGDRIAVMRKGVIAQIGRPQDIYARPADAFVARFVGAMNRIEGRVYNGIFTTGEGATGIAVPVAGADRPTALWFRPEAVRPGVGGNIRVRITSLTFFGPIQRAIAELAPGQTIQIDLPSDRAVTLGEVITFDLDPTSALELGDDA